MAIRPPDKGPNVQIKRKGVRHSVLYTIIGGALLLVTILCIVANRPEERQRDETPKVKAKAIKPVQSANAATNAEVSVEAPTKSSFTYRDEKGVLRYKNGGARAFDPDAKTKKITYGVDADGNALFRRSIFKNVAENEIARLITLRPGDSMIGMRRYDERFESEFRKSLETPIIISKDDSPEDAELKKSMIAVKIEICDRLAGGEKLKEILEGARSELQRLARVKRNIQQEVRSQIASDTSDADVQTYIDAANILLEKEGIAPIKGSEILRKNLILRSKGNTHEK